MGDFDFLESQGQRSSSRVPRPMPHQPSVDTTAQTSVPRFRPDPSKEQYLRLVMALWRIGAFLYFVLGLVGIVVVVFGLSREESAAVVGGAVMIAAGATGAIACMAAAELINLAIRATRAVEETAFLLRYMRRG